ncbi:GntP family permease [Nocardiopsis sp. HNM0947]|uniref:GntP family permease n=1 Tax=Nocardiopsis coralli TaxID=2772213 RepID=A0ABR9NZW1_9ACTN|nr:SLC13 family permease [Nocardiopsis coralli]MBE2997126.1 GntP family permease [Nocardiopsis coralli]
MDPQLLAALLLGIATIVVLVLKTRLDAFIALLLAAVLIGVVAGQPLLGVTDSIVEGFGTTLGDIGIVIGLGVAIGKLLQVSGAADALARAFLRLFGKGREPWALGSVGAAVSIPVFCDSAYIILNPLARSIARRRQRGYITLVIAMAGGMVLTHHFVPPTPGPLAVAGILGTDLGALILAGMVFTLFLLPVVVLYARWIGPRIEPSMDPRIREEVYGSAGADTAGPAGRGAGSSADEGPGEGTGGNEGNEADTGAEAGAHELGTPPDGSAPHRVGVLRASLPLSVPLLLIVLNTVATAVDRNNQGVLSGDYEPSAWAVPLAFLGNPVIALAAGILLAVYVLLPRWTPRRKVHGWLSEAAASAGLILLITGAGGALGQVLRDSGVGDALAGAVGALDLPAFLLPFLIASFVRVAQGSGTVSMITAASITAPMAASIGVDPLVATLACVAGAMVLSYFNDSFFWVVTRFAGLEGTAALKGHSGVTTLAWAASIPLLFLADLVLG